MQVAAFAEHPEEVGGVEIVEGGGDESAPHLRHGSRRHSANGKNEQRSVGRHVSTPFLR